MKQISKTYWIVILLTMVFFSSCKEDLKVYNSTDEWIASIENSITPISIDSLHAKIERYDEFYLIDVREPNEYYPAYIPSAVNIPNGLLLFKINIDSFWENAMMYTPKKDEPIIVYCKKGKRSMFAAYKLQKLGFTNVKYVNGGWMKWEENYPTLYEAQLEKLSGGSHKEVGGC